MKSMQLVWLLCAGLPSAAAENPIRRIVNLLQMQQKKIEKEGEAMDEMYEKYMCYCDTNEKALGVSIEQLNEQIPQQEATIKGKTELKSQLGEELKEHTQDREDAKGTIETATAQRSKDKAAFDAYKAEAMANIASIGKAVVALKKGLGESFLQSADAATLQRIVQASARVTDFDSSEVQQFLQGKMQGSGEILGILSQMGEDMEADLKDAMESEASAVTDFDGLLAAKEKEIAAATTAIEDKTEREGKTSVEIVNAKNDLADAQEALAGDTAYLAGLKKSCKAQTEAVDMIRKTRSEELTAIGATVKILNDDDALDLFKKTLPSPGESFMQVGMHTSSRARARLLVDHVQAVSAKAFGEKSQDVLRSQFVQLALKGKQAGFDVIKAKMDDFVKQLKVEQQNDDDQKKYCEKEIDRREDEEKDQSRLLAETESGEANLKEAVGTVKDAIASLVAGIKDLDKSVADATQTRKEENEEYQATKAQNSAAVQLLEVAKNQLNKFYNPTTYKAPPKRELTEEERLYVASGGTLTTPAPGGIAGTGIAFTQLSMSSSAPPPPPPAAVAAYKKSDSSGPVAMISNLVQDLKTEMKEDDMEESKAQVDYEELMQESAAKRATDAKTIVEKEEQKANAEANLKKTEKDKKSTQKELMSVREMMSGLHKECDFLLDNHALRKEARTNEAESIVKAKSVLSGADVSFVQVSESFLSAESRGCAASDAARRTQLAQSLAALKRDVSEACGAMCKAGDCACPDWAHELAPGAATWDQIYASFAQVQASGRAMVEQYGK